MKNWSKNLFDCHVQNHVLFSESLRTMKQSNMEKFVAMKKIKLLTKEIIRQMIKCIYPWKQSIFWLKNFANGLHLNKDKTWKLMKLWRKCKNVKPIVPLIRSVCKRIWKWPISNSWILILISCWMLLFKHNQKVLTRHEN